MVRLHLHGLSTCSGAPGGANYETPFTTHQTFTKLVTQIFLSAIELQKHNFLVTITSTSYLKTFRMISKDPDLRLIKQISIYLLESFPKIVNPLPATFIGLHTSNV